MNKKIIQKAPIFKFTVDHSNFNEIFHERAYRSLKKKFFAPLFKNTSITFARQKRASIHTFKAYSNFEKFLDVIQYTKKKME